MKHFVNAARSSDPRCSNSLEATWLYTTQTQMSLFITLYIIFFVHSSLLSNSTESVQWRSWCDFWSKHLIKAGSNFSGWLLVMTSKRPGVSTTPSNVLRIPAKFKASPLSVEESPWGPIEPQTVPPDAKLQHVQRIQMDSLTSRSVPVFQSMITPSRDEENLRFYSMQLRCLFSSRGWHPACLAVILNQRFLSHLEPLQLHQPLDWLCNGSDQLISPTAVD